MRKLRSRRRLETYAGLIKSGKVRAIGASNYKADRLAESLKASAAKGLPRYETLQPWYNLYDRADFEGGLADLCKRENIAVIPYFSLASGFLTGKYRSEKDLAGRARAYRVKDMLNERGFRILKALDTRFGGDRCDASAGFAGVAGGAAAWPRRLPARRISIN